MFNAMEFLTDITFFGLAFFISFVPHFIFKNGRFRVIYSGFQLVVAIVAVISVLFMLNSAFIFKDDMKNLDYFIIMYSAFILFLCVSSSAYVLIKNLLDDYEASVKSLLKEI